MTLVGEQQRKLLKEVVRRAPAGVKSRSLPDAVIAHYKNLIETQESDVTEIIKQVGSISQVWSIHSNAF